MAQIRELIVSAPKGNEAYTWFEYTGKPLEMHSRLGTNLRLKKGSRFGVRPSGDRRKIRFVAEELGVNKVFTLSPEQATYLAKRCKSGGKR